MQGTPEQTTGLFTHGLEFLFPRTEDGPSLYALLEAAWTVTALVRGIRERVWDQPVAGPNPIAVCWVKLGLLEVVNAQEQGAELQSALRVTPAGHRVISCQGLLEYEFDMMQQQLSGNFETDPAKYARLRQGLAAYTTAFLPDTLQWVAEQAQPALGRIRPLMFDFCGGEGGYLHHFLRQWPEGQGILFDRQLPDYVPADVKPRMAAAVGDAFGSDEFFAQHAGAYDIVLLSEILHCKGYEARLELLRRAKALCKPGGVVLVVEQYPNLRLEWRMNDMTEAGQCLSEQQTAVEAAEVGLIAVSGIHSLSHYGIRLEQEQ